MLKIITQKTLDDLTQQALTSERKRKNLNIHDNYADPCQRLFNAMEPQTYIRPHRHMNPPKPECFMAIRGRLGLVVFDDDGQVAETRAFGQECEIVAIEVPAGVWHAIVSFESGSVFFETKPGPYVPLDDKDFAPWSPRENSLDAEGYLDNLKNQFK